MSEDYWSVSSAVIKGLVRYAIGVLPATAGVFFMLLFRGLESAYWEVYRFHAWCWPEFFDRHESEVDK